MYYYASSYALVMAPDIRGDALGTLEGLGCSTQPRWSGSSTLAAGQRGHWQASGHNLLFLIRVYPCYEIETNRSRMHDNA
jgi:hypothetical protein